MVDYCEAFSLCRLLLAKYAPDCCATPVMVRNADLVRSKRSRWHILDHSCIFTLSFCCTSNTIFVFLKSAVLWLVGITRLFGAQSARRQTFQTSVLFVDTPRLLDGDIICLNRPVRCDDVMRTTETHLLLHTVLRIVASAVLQNTIFMAIFEHPFAFVARHGCRQEIGLKVTQTKRKESEGDTWWYIWERYMCTELVNHD